jgi:hypothetical protein
LRAPFVGCGAHRVGAASHSGRQRSPSDDDRQVIAQSLAGPHTRSLAMLRSSPLSQFVRALVVGAGALALATGAQAAGDKNAYEHAKASAKSAYEAAEKQCDTMNGNAKDVCVAEAKAARTKADVEAEATYKATPKAREHAAEEIAEANYKVAKERCDDRTGNDKDVCVKVAKSELTKAKADAKAHRKTVDARSDADKEKREADYKVAAEKCDAMNGDAKSACVKNAKAKYGM